MVKTYLVNINTLIWQRRAEREMSFLSVDYRCFCVTKKPYTTNIDHTVLHQFQMPLSEIAAFFNKLDYCYRKYEKRQIYYHTGAGFIVTKKAM